MEIKPDVFGHSSPRSMEWMHFITVLHDFGFTFEFFGEDMTGGRLINVATGERLITPGWLHRDMSDRLRATRNWVISWFEGYIYGKFGINTHNLP